MIIGQFLKSNKEKVDKEFDEIVEGIIKTYSTKNWIHKTNKKMVIIPRISYAKSLQTL